MSDRNRIIELIAEKNNFNLISHMLPDGDSIGSLLAMGRCLGKMGKNVSMFAPGHIPLKYSFLKGADLILSDDTLFDATRTVIVLDSSDADRLGNFKEKVLKSPELINIDHHVTNQHYGTLNYVDPDASATGEIVFGLLEPLKVELDFDLAEALYVAIATDTGSFKYDNTSSHTHTVISRLLQTGISPGALSQKIFDERPLSFFILLKEALSSLEMYLNRTIAIMTISKDIMIRSGASTDDLDGIVNYTRNIEGVELGILFYVELENEVKIGFRSKRLDVSLLAGKLNGGGHVRAAGCRMHGSFEAIKEKVLAEAFAMISELPKEDVN